MLTGWLVHLVHPPAMIGIQTAVDSAVLVRRKVVVVSGADFVVVVSRVLRDAHGRVPEWSGGRLQSGLHWFDSNHGLSAIEALSCGLTEALPPGKASAAGRDGWGHHWGHHWGQYWGRCPAAGSSRRHFPPSGPRPTGPPDDRPGGRGTSWPAQAVAEHFGARPAGDLTV